ncbi:hypothetical protein HU200_038292 [Digitaria exilis]|uniref:Heparan-alpha-glucosaminide N-acetyltransferase catalytic domain-containing protein n=1 Tax=Digitaria exilis TaxID=1010633 RepID=A0A835ELZ9_9POAL|nr:hypothetical protein HU200_038292 [Digitaria exilis]
MSTAKSVDDFPAGGSAMLGMGPNEGHAGVPDIEAGGTAGAQSPATPRPRGQRLVSLDVFRGITVVLMIVADDVGGLVPAISHSPWDGVTLADFVFPFFLFIVGVSLAFAYKRVPNKAVATKKAAIRASKLFLLGLLLQGGFFHSIHDLTYGVDVRKMRLMGVLQRIAIAYLAVALCEIWLRGGAGDIGAGGYALLRRYRHQLFVGLVLTVTYTTLLYGMYVPDWEYEFTSQDSTLKHFMVKCGVRGHTGPGCNAVGMIDRHVLGIQHLYKHPVYLKTVECSINSPQNGPLPSDAPTWCEAPFDPEGLLSSLMAIVTCLIGLQIGHVIVHFKEHAERIVRWSIPSLSFLILGFSLDLFGLHMNKSLYSLSYTCVTTGTAGLFFAGIYLLVDVYGYKKPFSPMEWVGKHALLIFVLVACDIVPILVHGFYWREPKNNLLKFIGIGG